MSLSVWFQLAEAVSIGLTPASQITAVLRILTSSIQTTQEEIADLVELLITAGKGFLLRAEREPEKRTQLIAQAQDEFTKLIRYERKPMLSSRASH